MDVWGISASVKGISALWGDSIRFIVPNGTTHEKLTHILKAKDFEVVSIVPAYL